MFWALDPSAALYLQDRNYTMYFNPSYYSNDEFAVYHTEKYIKLMAERPKFWRTVLQTGYDMLFLDSDIIFFKNPQLDLIGDADLEGQIDEFELEQALDPDFYPEMCGGGFFLKSNERSVTFLNELERLLILRPDGIIDDQQAINRIIHNTTLARIINRKSPSEPDERLSVRYIPFQQYLNGWLFRSHSYAQILKPHKMTYVINGTMETFEPSLVHLNGANPEGGKLGLMKKFGWWDLYDNHTCRH